MKTLSTFTGCLLCTTLLLTGCVKDPIHVAQPTVTITGTYELHKGEPLGMLALAGSVEYNGQQVEGTLAWKDASTIYKETGEQQAEWVFTPANESLYAETRGEIGLTVVPNIYVCGVGVDEYKNLSNVWKNGNMLYTLADEISSAAPGNGTVILDGSIYICGYKKDENRKKIAKIWKDGNVLYNLTDGTNDAIAIDIIFSDGHFYTCGYETGENGKQIAKIWKDGNVLYNLTDGTNDASATGILFSDGHFYTCGHEIGENGKQIAKIWKDGNVLYNLPQHENSSAYPGSVRIIDGTLYTAGHEFSHNTYKHLTKIWKNDTVLYMTDESLNTSFCGMDTSNGNIYLCVKEERSNNGTILKVLKNGKVLYQLTDGNRSASVYSLVVSGDDVYTCGHEFIPENGVPVGKVWKNDTLLYEMEGVFYTDILVD